jgi:hypothetical protein
MPVGTKRNIIEVDDTSGVHHQLPYYCVYVFKKEIPIILFYLSRGITYTLDYLHVSSVIKFIDKEPPEDDDEYIYFQLSSKCWLKCDRSMFKEHAYIRSVVGAFCLVCTNRTTVENLDDRRSWIKKIANPANYEKGMSILNSFDRLLDETTKKVLKLPRYHTEDTYALLRWQMEHFQELRLKDNLDLDNKRLRCNEYIASLMTAEFSRRLKRIITMGDKVNIMAIKELLNSSIIRRLVMQTV